MVFDFYEKFKRLRILKMKILISILTFLFSLNCLKSQLLTYSSDNENCDLLINDKFENLTDSTLVTGKILAFENGSECGVFCSGGVIKFKPSQPTNGNLDNCSML